MDYDFPYIGNFIIPTDFHPSFLRGVGIPHQPDCFFFTSTSSGCTMNDVAFKIYGCYQKKIVVALTI